MNKIYLYKTVKSSVAYDDEYWYINGVVQNPSGDIRTEAMTKAYELFADNLGAFLSHFRNLAVLTAAGTSMENGAHGGKTRTELWNSYRSEITKIVRAFKLDGRLGGFVKKCKEIVKSKDIENFLSFVILYEKVHGELQSASGEKLREKLEQKIADACRLKLDSENKHHEDFLRKLTARKPSEPRVQLFTTNYDTLFEQAAQKMNYTIIDGFSFAYPRIFNGSNFDLDVVYRDRTRIKNEESFVPNVIQLFKLHGSIDWERREDGVIFQREKVDSPCIIYPASEKYESSYERPYIEMISHFQQVLRKESTLLIVAGFGFKDKHIQNIIKEAVAQNPNFHLVIACYAGADRGINSDLVGGFVTQESNELKIDANVSIIYTGFKDFVNHFPMNNSYDVENRFNNEPI